MTNRERLISLLGFAAPKEATDGALIDAGITGASTYDGSLSKDLKRCAISLMELLLTTPDTTNVDNFYIKYDRDAVLKRIKLLKDELGIVDSSRPTITSPKVW